MPLADADIDLMRDSLRLFQSRTGEIADAFYETLFRIEPELRPLFGDDIDAQTEKTMLALGAIVAQLHRIEAFRPMVGELARRHVAYGVKVGYYPLVGEALLTTIRQVFGDTLEPAVYDAWDRGYTEIAAHMIDQAGYEDEPKAGAGPAAAQADGLAPEAPLREQRTRSAR